LEKLDGDVPIVENMFKNHFLKVQFPDNVSFQKLNQT